MEIFGKMINECTLMPFFRGFNEGTYLFDIKLVRHDLKGITEIGTAVVCLGHEKCYWYLLDALDLQDSEKDDLEKKLFECSKNIKDVMFDW